MRVSTFDKSLELKTDAAVTTSGDETLILCNPRKLGAAKVVANVTEANGSGLEIYVNASPTVGGTKTKVARLPAISENGKYEIPISGEHIASLVPTAEALGIGFIAGASVVSFNVQAYLAPEI